MWRKHWTRMLAHHPCCRWTSEHGRSHTATDTAADPSGLEPTAGRGVGGNIVIGLIGLCVSSCKREPPETWLSGILLHAAGDGGACGGGDLVGVLVGEIPQPEGRRILVTSAYRVVGRRWRVHPEEGAWRRYQYQSSVTIRV